MAGGIGSRLYECKVVVQGLDGYIVAEKHGQLLVCSCKSPLARMAVPL